MKLFNPFKRTKESVRTNVPIRQVPTFTKVPVSTPPKPAKPKTPGEIGREAAKKNLSQAGE